MKVSAIVFSPLFVLVFLFLLNPIALGMPIHAVSEGLKEVFGSLRIRMERLSPEEIKFLEEFMEKSPTSMVLDNEKKRRAILEGSSSYAEKVYRKIFFSRLNPHSDEEMSVFFESLERYQLSIYNKMSERKGVSEERGLNLNPFSRKDYIKAWRRATHGTLYAIRNGEFNISLSDFHALYANEVSRNLGHSDIVEALRSRNSKLLEDGRISADTHDYFSELSEENLKIEVAIGDLMSFFQGTSKKPSPNLSRLSQDPAALMTRIYYAYRKAADVEGDTYDELQRLLNQPPKVEGFYLKTMSEMFTSPFYRPSKELKKLFDMILERDANVLNNAGMILRLWNSGILEYQKLIAMRLKLDVLLAARIGKVSESEFSSLRQSGSVMMTQEKVADVYRALSERKFFKAISKAAADHYEISGLIEYELRLLDEPLNRVQDEAQRRQVH